MISDKAKVFDVEPRPNLGIRAAVLILLCVQNAGHALLARYSQGILKEQYSSSEVVLVAEAIKLLICGYQSVVDDSESDAAGKGSKKLLWLLVNSKKILVLVVLYSFANVVSYYALARIEASVYSVTQQLKIFTTAVFAVVILGRSISSAKWRALLLLVLGCVLVSSPTFNKPIDCTEALKNTAAVLAKAAHSRFESIVGISCVLVNVVISGYSAVYFEQMLKTGEKITIWERNFQLAFYSIVLLLGVVIYEMSTNANAPTGSAGAAGAGAEVNANESIFFRGWTVCAVILCFVQASGGLLVAATLKYADAVLKTLATAAAIVLSTVLGWMLLGGVLDVFVIIGCVCTILAICNYTWDTTTV